MAIELRALAERILSGESLDEKLTTERTVTDASPGAASVVSAPARGERLRIVSHREAKVPGSQGMADPAQRVRILHSLANHELQAVELFAWAVLAFPDAPAEFRQGLRHLIADEQKHTRMYIARLAAHGAAFGDYPVSGYFWNKIKEVRTPLEFVCAMSLTFENANLDHTDEYAAAARAAGDVKSAAAIEIVQRDEIEHVRFGWQWLNRFKQRDESAWEAYDTALHWPLHPAKARGRAFNRVGRERAGLDDAFIRRLESSTE